METDNLLVFVAVLAVVLSVAGTIVTYNSVANRNNFLTGFVVEEGVVNVTIETLANIEIISAGGSVGQKNITWGAGKVNVTGGNTYAILATNGTVYMGEEWGAISEGFVVRNIGNINVTLDIHATPIAAGFIGGTGPEFKYNVTNVETGSCASFPGSVEGLYRDFLAVGDKERICNVFQFGTDNDEIMIDVLLKIPSDSSTGARSSVVTLTYDGIL
jgi:hypothetical protein